MQDVHCENRFKWYDPLISVKQATRRLVRDNILRLAVALLLFDWIVVRWPTFVWLDLAAIGIAALTFQIDVESEDPKPAPRRNVRSR